jgi:IS5 family transposase
MVSTSLLVDTILHAFGCRLKRGSPDVYAPRAQDFTNRRYRHRGVVDEAEKALNRTKSSIHAKVKHVFAVIKQKFGFAKVRYKGWQRTPIGYS